jgi:hypothetical protein
VRPSEVGVVVASLGKGTKVARAEEVVGVGVRSGVGTGGVDELSGDGNGNDGPSPGRFLWPFPPLLRPAPVGFGLFLSSRNGFRMGFKSLKKEGKSIAGDRFSKETPTQLLGCERVRNIWDMLCD